MAEIYHVVGLPGSGKSHILNFFDGIKKIELDEIMTKAYFNLRNKQNNDDPKVWNTEERKTEEENIMMREIDSVGSNPIIITGITVKIPSKYTDCIRGYILKPKNDSELKDWYRRAMMRDFEKTIENRERIYKLIKSDVVEFMSKDIQMSMGGLGLSISDDYIPYTWGYDHMVKEFKTYTHFSQEEVIEDIKKRLKQSTDMLTPNNVYYVSTDKIALVEQYLTSSEKIQNLEKNLQTAVETNMLLEAESKRQNEMK